MERSALTEKTCAMKSCGVVKGKRKVMRKKRRVKNTVGTVLWNKRIEPYCKHAAAHRGFHPRLAEKLSAEYGVNVVAAQVQQWLAPDENVRVEPRAGVASILIEACNELIKTA